MNKSLDNFLVERLKKYILKKFAENKQLWVSDLIRYTKDIIREKNYEIYFPVCISLDNCVGYFTPSKFEDDLIIKENSIIKLEVGIKLGDQHHLIGETIFLNDHDHVNDQFKQIQACFKEIKEGVKKIRSAIDDDILTTDDIRLFIEGHLAEYHLAPLQNCISFQQSSDDTLDPGYFYLNYRKEYDSNDYLIPMPNLNFDIHEGDTYDINIVVTRNEIDDFPLKFVVESGSIFKVNNNNPIVNLKTKSARQLMSLVKSKVAFDFEDLDFQKVGLTKLSSRLGLKECVSSGFLEEYHVHYTKDKRPVFHLKFSVTF